MSDQNQEYVKQLKLKRNRIILAFPGMGKTPLSMIKGKFKDVDFGTFRTGMGFTKENEVELLPKFRDYVAALDADWSNCVLMTNEPKLMRYIKFDRVYLPDQKVIRYSAKKMGVDTETIKKWIVEWWDMACRYRIPVTILKCGLDHYFNR